MIKTRDEIKEYIIFPHRFIEDYGEFKGILNEGEDFSLLEKLVKQGLTQYLEITKEGDEFLTIFVMTHTCLYITIERHEKLSYAYSQDKIKLYAELKHSNDRISELEKAKVDLTTQISDLSSRISDLTTQNSDLSSRISDLTTQNSDLSLRFSDLEGKILETEKKKNAEAEKKDWETEKKILRMENKFLESISKLERDMSKMYGDFIKLLSGQTLKTYHIAYDEYTQTD